MKHHLAVLLGAIVTFTALPFAAEAKSKSQEDYWRDPRTQAVHRSNRIHRQDVRTVHRINRDHRRDVRHDRYEDRYGVRRAPRTVWQPGHYEWRFFRRVYVPGRYLAVYR